MEATCPFKTQIDFQRTTPRYILQDGALQNQQKKSQSYVMTDGQPASLSCNKTPIWGLWQDFDYCLTVAGLLIWGALSNERTGLSFAITTGPCQSNHFWVRVP
jgi:hypothetical protein